MSTVFPTHDDAWYEARLRPPKGNIRVIIDTDCANEIDDQFALAWALYLTDSFALEAVYASPFSFAHRRSLYPDAVQDAVAFEPPSVGMRRSYEEIIRVFDLMERDWRNKVFQGSHRYLSSLCIPEISEASGHLVTTARACSADQPLYVLAMGCVTNVSNALLIAPDIVDNIVVIWTSGYPTHAPHVNDSFNLEQDLYASQILLDSGVPLVYLPGFHVGAQLRLSLAEVERYVLGKSEIGTYLHQLFTTNPLWPIMGLTPKVANLKPHTWVIWDMICVAWIHRHEWVPSRLVRTPRLTIDKRWEADASRPWMREAYAVNRDEIFNDFFARLDH